MLYDVPLAVAIFTLPSLFSNLWQGWRFRTHRVGPALTWVFAVAGAAGAAAGSVVLISLSSDLLLLGVAGAGKSTLMKILSGFEQPTSGTLLVDGRATHFNGSQIGRAHV